MSRIYLSYRRMDAPGYAGRLFDHLSRHFGRRSVFMDIDGIAGGREFARVIESALNACDAVLVLIGKNWADCTGPDGRRRLDDPEDWVRLEVAAALRRDVLVIPVLIDGARLPEPTSLPEELRALCGRQSRDLSDLRWSHDVGVLVKDLGEVVRAANKRLRRLAGLTIILAALLGMALTGRTVVWKKPASMEVKTDSHSPSPNPPPLTGANLFVADGSFASIMRGMARAEDGTRPAAAEEVQGQPASAEVRAAIREGYNRFAAAAARGDLQAYKAVHATNYVVRNGAKVTDAETHFLGMQMAFALGPVTVTCDLQKVIMTAPDTAVATVQFDVKDAFLHRLEKDRDVWKRIGDQWLLKECNVLEQHTLD